MTNKFSILFVCMGNICRSPTAEGVFRSYMQQSCLNEKVVIDSAGTTSYHSGEKSDPRSIKAASQRGYNLNNILSRQVTNQDFELFDLILAMDANNYSNLIEQAKQAGFSDNLNKIKLFLDFSKQESYSDVPDPYYGGNNGFNLVIDLIEDASQGLVNYLELNLKKGTI